MQTMVLEREPVCSSVCVSAMVIEGSNSNGRLVGGGGIIAILLATVFPSEWIDLHALQMRLSVQHDWVSDQPTYFKRENQAKTRKEVNTSNVFSVHVWLICVCVRFQLPR